MSIPELPHAEGQEFTNDATGVTYKFDGVKWIAFSSGEGIDLSGYVRKEGGDSMEGPLTMRPQAGADTRQTNRVQTLGVFSNSAASSLRLGTDRDRIYVGSNDTSFNGPIKVDELQEKNAGGGISTTNKIVVRANGIVERPVSSGTAGDGFAFQGRVDGGSSTQIQDKLLSVYHNSGDEPDAVNYQGKTSNPDNIQNRQSVLSITDPIAADVSKNTQDIVSLHQEVNNNFASKNHNHDGAYALIDHTHDFSVDDATQSKKGIAFLGQAITGTSTAPSLKSGQLYWNTSNKTLYIGN